MARSPKTVRIGFLVNPIAGMGGRVGLKGTDGVAATAAALGARPLAGARATEMLRALHPMLEGCRERRTVHWLTCSGVMGADALRDAGFQELEVVHEVRGESSADDTRAGATACRIAGADLMLFSGGDGTARDLCAVLGESIPMLGIPAGVKMYSGVFGTNPTRTAEIVFRFIEGGLTGVRVEVLDLDEERYRRGEWAVRLYFCARTPFEPHYTQMAKQVVIEEGDDALKAEIARHVVDVMATHPDALFLLGPGSTVQAIGIALGIDKTLLGVDAVAGRKLIGKDLDERRILGLLATHAQRKLVVSPLGAQGFVLGRGNLQISPEVVGEIGRSNLIVVATPAKLAVTPVLRFDTGSAAVDRDLVGDGYLPVITGHHRRRLVPAAV